MKQIDCDKHEPGCSSWLCWWVGTLWKILIFCISVPFQRPEPGNKHSRQAIQLTSFQTAAGKTDKPYLVCCVGEIFTFRAMRASTLCEARTHTASGWKGASCLSNFGIFQPPFSLPLSLSLSISLSLLYSCHVTFRLSTQVHCLMLCLSRAEGKKMNLWSIAG